MHKDRFLMAKTFNLNHEKQTMFNHWRENQAIWAY